MLFKGLCMEVLLRLTFFKHIRQNEFLRNLFLTFHSWSPFFDDAIIQHLHRPVLWFDVSGKKMMVNYKYRSLIS